MNLEFIPINQIFHLQSNETAFDLSKIDLSLDKNSIEIADVKKSFTPKKQYQIQRRNQNLI